MSDKEVSKLYHCLKEYFGFDNFKGNQEAVIRNVLDGNDTFVLMPTGGGKSLCHQLPALMMDGVAIVLSLIHILSGYFRDNRPVGFLYVAPTPVRPADRQLRSDLLFQ